MTARPDIISKCILCG